MPRPAKDDPRDINLTIRFSSAEMIDLQRRAEAVGCSLAAYARQAIFGAAVDYATVPASAPPPDPGAFQLAEQVRRVGVNLNQIARQFNAFSIRPPDELIETLAEIRSYVRQAQAQP